MNTNLPKPPFKVRCINDDHGVPLNLHMEYTVIAVKPHEVDGYRFQLDGDLTSGWMFKMARFEILEAKDEINYLTTY